MSGAGARYARMMAVSLIIALVGLTVAWGQNGGQRAIADAPVSIADLHVVGKELEPYYQDLYDHVLRVAEWTDSLRDLVNSILETNLVIQSNRLNIITKKVTGWAAIIAVPTLITGYFGMNVPYPGFGHTGGFVASVATIVLAGLILYLVFKRNDWL